jgi:hypothetical protein
MENIECEKNCEAGHRARGGLSMKNRLTPLALITHAMPKNLLVVEITMIGQRALSAVGDSVDKSKQGS